MNRDWKIVQLGEAAERVERLEEPKPGTTYRQIGVRLWGEGAYEREALDGGDTKYRYLNRVSQGDLIVNKIWARNGSVSVVPEALSGCVASSEFPLFAPDRSQLASEWFYWLTKTREFWGQCERQSFGTSGKNRIRPEQFLKIEIPLPPLTEQRRIVAKIERLAGKVDEAKRLRNEAILSIPAVATGLLASAVPSDAPTRLLAELVADGTRLSYGVLVPGPDIPDGIPFVRVQDLDVKHPAELPGKRISPHVNAQYSRTRLNGGEVLIGVVGSIGKLGIAPRSWRGANIARAVCRIVPSPEVDARYLAAVLASDRCQRQFRDMTRTLAQPTLNIGQLAETVIPLPPINEQQQIVAALSVLQERVDGASRLQAQTATELDALLPSILDRAFRGEL